MENVENQSQESCVRVFGNECQRNWGVVAVVKLSLEMLHCYLLVALFYFVLPDCILNV